MPNLDGVAAARSIRARHPEARVVVLSAHFTRTLAREATDAGACACFPKERLKDLLALLRDSPPGSPETTSPPAQSSSNVFLQLQTSKKSNI